MPKITIFYGSQGAAKKKTRAAVDEVGPRSYSMNSHVAVWKMEEKDRARERLHEERFVGIKQMLFEKLL